MATQRIAVIGGVAAGPAAAAEAVRVDPEAEVVLFDRGDHISYGACEMPYYVADWIEDVEKLIVLTPSEFERTRGAEVRVRHEVTEIDPGRSLLRVRHDAREEELRFDKFILATGARARLPDLEGVEADNVFVLRRLDDAVGIKRYLETREVTRAVVFGAGYIGLEIAEAFRSRGIEVAILEPAGRPLPGYVEGRIAEVVGETLRSKGVGIRHDFAVELETDGPGRVTAVVTDRGERIECQVVVAAMGLIPNTELVERAGGRVGRTGALEVDAGMRTNLPNVWACGDLVEVRRVVDDRPAYLPLSPTAFRTARVAARNAARGDGSSPASFPGVCPASAVKVFDMEVAALGIKLGEAREVGFDAFAVEVEHTSRVGIYPGSKPIWVRYVVERPGGRLLGAALAGEEGAAHRADVLVPLVREGWTVHEMLDLDLVYSPPVAPAHDPLLVAASRAVKQLS